MTVPVPSVTALPEFPGYSDPNFNPKAYAWGIAQPVFGADLVAVGNATLTNANEAAGAATSAGTSAANAAGSAETALNAALAAEAIANTSFWQSGQAYTRGQVVWSQAQPGTRYLRLNDGAGAADPADDPANWARVGAKEQLQIQAINASTAAVPGTYYLMTQPGITLTMPNVSVNNDTIGFANISSGETVVNWSGKTVSGILPSPNAMAVPQQGRGYVMWSVGANTWGVI